ncbi:MAG: winged helix DNA-binding protein, partial [Porphyromonas sp.]|nr:winged helix DNA-binding protein [Porphyromonas sp.]
ERSTGNEMLRRLARLGLVIEMDDPVDKRQKLVQLTPLGRAELMKVFPDLRKVTQLLTHTLDSWQKLYLRNLLSQMTARHLTLMRDLKDVPITDYLDEVNRKGKSPEL